MPPIPIPSIDFLSGRPCRLKKGERGLPEFYESDPASRALLFQSLGAKRFHCVNLDGAFRGGSSEQGGDEDTAAKNRKIINLIARALEIPIQVGGGFRTSADINTAWRSGITSVILGTSALDPDDQTIVILQNPANADRIIADIGFDADEVKIHGWKEDTGMTVSMAMAAVYRNGFRTVVMTDKSRDGMQTGPNLAIITREAWKNPDVQFIISGGIGTVEHLKAIKAIELPNIFGFIMGKRLWAEDGLDFFQKAVSLFS